MIDLDLAPLAAMAPPRGRRPVPANCTVGELGIDATYQRALGRDNITLIRAIAKDWDWTLCQPLIVARRHDDSLWVVDGQHRLLAARLRSDIYDLPCIVVHYGSIEAEAQGFVALNTRRRPLTAYALWRAAIASNDAQALALQAMLAGHGMHVESGADYKNWKPGGLNNIGALQKLFRAEPNRLDRVLGIIAAAFPGEVLQFGATFVQAINNLIKLIPFDDGALVEQLRGRTQGQWADRFSALAGEPGHTLYTAAPEVLRRALGGGIPAVNGATARPTSGAVLAVPSRVPAKPLTHEEKMAKVAAGAPLVEVQRFRKADPDMTLGGVGSASL